MLDNPYTIRGPLQDARLFYGRFSELNEISTFLRGNQSVSVVGPPEIGKTSLMLHLMRAETKVSFGIGNDILFSYINCHELSGLHPNEVLAFFCREIAHLMRSSGLHPQPGIEDLISDSTWLRFEVAIHDFNKLGFKVVLILDEFEQLTINSHLEINFYNALRSIASRFQVSYITCSTKPMIDLIISKDSACVLSSPFFNIFAQINLGLLTESESRQLIRRPMEECGLVVSSQLEEFIYSLVGGHPLALQVACRHAWDHPGDYQAIESRTRLELEVHFEKYWSGLDQAERYVLQHPIEMGMREKSDPSLRKIFRDLNRNCFLAVRDQSYRYPSRAWEEFVTTRKIEPLPLSLPVFSRPGDL